MIETAVQILYRITVALEVPVVIGVLVGVAWSLFEGGRFLREWLARRRGGASCLAPAPPTAATPPGELDDLLHEMEFRAARRLARVRVGLRLGPVLGLMGTLIPMGPALVGVSQGELTVMSEKLIIAFSTTVAGLFVGAVCYVLLTTRRYWYAKDIADVERLAIATEKGGGA